MERKFPLGYRTISDLNPKRPDHGMMPPLAWMGLTRGAVLALKSATHLVVWNHDDPNRPLGDLSDQLLRRHLRRFGTTL